MPAARYVFISDQGRVFSSADEPTLEDFEYVAVGMLTIVRMEDGRYYGRARKWLPIPVGRLISAEIDGDPRKLLHGLSSDSVAGE
jgi:hypothetical protein